MTLAPNETERLARARADLRMGVPVVVTSGSDGAMILAVETMGPERFDEVGAMEGAVLAITARRAETLKARAYDGDLARVKLPKDANLAWAQAIADPADDLRTPMKGPLVSLREGSADLHRVGLALVKSARLIPSVLVVPIKDAETFAQANGLTSMAFSDLNKDTLSPMSEVIKAKLPLAASEAGRLHVFRPDDGGEEHYAIEIGDPDRNAPVLTRLHSACFTGDVMGSLKCDCGPQLRGALGQMGEEGAGILLYLNQEGRGIGLANKMRAYSLQDQGFDTVEANHRLGFEDDERDFRIGADILRKLGFSKVRLLTNNPAKVDRLVHCGLEVVERVPLKVGENRHNHNYLATKAKKSGHLL